MVDSLTAAERETVITTDDASDTVMIWTAQRRHINRMRSKDAFTETGSGHYGSSEWATFTIAADDWNPATGAKRRRKPLTDEQRAELTERLQHP